MERLAAFTAGLLASSAARAAWVGCDYRDVCGPEYFPWWFVSALMISGSILAWRENSSENERAKATVHGALFGIAASAFTLLAATLLS